jgi:hypothetical protein
MRRNLSLGLLLLLACEVRRAPPRPADGEDRAVREEVAQYYRDMSARDWSAYRSHFWPGATLTTVWAPPGAAGPKVAIMTIEQFLAQTGAGPDSKPLFEERLLGQEVRVMGNLAQVWARYEARFGDSTSVATWRGIDAFTWMKHEGRWRIVALAYTDEPGEPAGAR